MVKHKMCLVFAKIQHKYNFQLTSSSKTWDELSWYTFCLQRSWCLIGTESQHRAGTRIMISSCFLCSRLRNPATSFTVWTPGMLRVMSGSSSPGHLTNHQYVCEQLSVSHCFKFSHSQSASEITVIKNKRVNTSLCTQKNISSPPRKKTYTEHFWKKYHKS